ncbi:MAG: glycosyltransferase family 2 protein [Deltaproteobacteria bacterium]|nr:glycosyltransferase family 2 protein [Candidatus Deferrimicrobium borealis]
MTSWTMCKPVAFLVFNRPDTTARVFEAIRQARPPRLLVVADGPRGDKPGEAERCDAVRRIIDWVDWPCEVLKNYSDTNLGCKNRVSSGLDWVFETVEEAIILEDDCLPHPTFFRFCEELLDRYRDDERVAQIGGANFQFGKKRTPYSYYFSVFNHIWGWATWRRVWRSYDLDMTRWPEIRDSKWLRDFSTDTSGMEFWYRYFQKAYQGEIDTWDYQWAFSCWLQRRLTVLPNINLVSNIGFLQDATHTKSSRSRLGNIPTEPLQFPLIHPPYIARNVEADTFTDKNMFRPGLVRIFLEKVSQVIYSRNLKNPHPFHTTK